jgi:hypothetical protein
MCVHDRFRLCDLKTLGLESLGEIGCISRLNDKRAAEPLRLFAYVVAQMVFAPRILWIEKKNRAVVFDSEIRCVHITYTVEEAAFLSVSRCPGSTAVSHSYAADAFGFKPFPGAASG